MNDEQRSESIPAERLSIEKRSDGTIVVAVETAVTRGPALPPARFSFREGDPQYAYWMRRFDALPRARAAD